MRVHQIDGASRTLLISIVGALDYHLSNSAHIFGIRQEPHLRDSFASPLMNDFRRSATLRLSPNSTNKQSKSLDFQLVKDKLEVRRSKRSAIKFAGIHHLSANRIRTAGRSPRSKAR
jgi:hypothetical protein